MAQVICLLGPTASGKTDLAVSLYRDFPGRFELISVDSALVYRGMDIGTAKPSPELLADVPHHLIDIRDPSETYSAADFCDDAHGLIEDILVRDRTPLLVGGTMLYFRSLLQGLAEMPAADEALREKLLQEAEERGWEYLHERLQQVDPVASQRIRPSDTQRLQRALEVYELTGRPISEFQSESARSFPYSTLQIGLMPVDRSGLHRRIEQRFQLMINAGLVQEVEALRARGNVHDGLPSMRAVGYRQVWAYLEGEFDYDEMVYRGIVATRQLAKRQMTWMRSWPDLRFIDTDPDVALQQTLKMLG